MSLAQPHPTQLLTTRKRSAVAVAVAAYLFVLAIRGPLHPACTKFEPLPSLYGLVPGWFATAINLAFYAFLCWAAFQFIYDARGRERLFMTGFFAELLLSPLRLLGSYWAAIISHIGMLGYAVALLAALSIVLRPCNSTDSGS